MLTGDPRELTGLLLGYIDGDVVAKKIVLDWLEEQDDPRREAVAAEAIDWDGVAHTLAGVKRPRRRRNMPTVLSGQIAYLRFQIDCACVGADTTPVVREAVRASRRMWLQELFPELDLDAR